jgi:hypothetical protein
LLHKTFAESAGGRSIDYDWAGCGTNPGWPVKARVALSRGRNIQAAMSAISAPAAPATGAGPAGPHNTM